MVVGWFEDRTNRIKFENEFVHQFRQRGAMAVMGDLKAKGLIR